MSPCQGCHSGCCRTFAVPVTGADIIRIENNYDLSFWDFVCRWEDREGMISRNNVPQFYFSDEPETPFVVCLAHRPSQSFPDTTRCRFLQETAPDEDHPLGQGKCSIYEKRPQTCRIFPTRLNDSAELMEIYPIPEFGHADQKPPHRLCSRPWELGDVDPIDGLHDLVASEYEMIFFRKVAMQWNQRKMAWSLFPQFLRIVYEGRVVNRNEATVREAEPKILPFPGIKSARKVA